MNKDEESGDAPVVRRLDAMIGLMISHLISQDKIGVGQIYKSLRDSGLTPSEIGRIVDRKAKDVSATITMHQKSKNKNTKDTSQVKHKKEGSD